jgi:hypothetical protein
MQIYGPAINEYLARGGLLQYLFATYSLQHSVLPYF